MQWKLGAIAVLSACLVVGCDKDDSSSTPVNPTPDSSALHPTTQQLQDGPRSALDLKFIPVTLQVPAGWEVKSYDQGLVATVEGPTLTDVVSISLPSSRSITADQENGLEQLAKQDMELHPDLLSNLGVRDLAGGKVIEHLVVDPVVPTTQEAAAAPTTEPLQTMQWTFTICVPSDDGKGFTAYDLRFLGMTLKQYKADQAFLRPIIASLALNPSK